MTALASLFTLIDVYCVATGLAEATVSTRLFSDGKRIASLRLGGDMGVRRLERALQWFSDNWPSEADWPADIARPEVPATETSTRDMPDAPAPENHHA